MSDSAETTSGLPPVGTDQGQTAAATPPLDAPATATPAIAPAVEPVKAKAPEYVTVGFMYKFVLIVAILSSCLAVFVYDRMFATKILVFDLQQYLTKIRSDAVSNKLTPEEFKARLDRMEAAVTSVPKGTVVITGDVVLGDYAKQLEVQGFKPEKKSAQAQTQPAPGQAQ